MKTTTALFAAMLACAVAATAQENYAQWQHSKDITLNTSATGANVTANVVNFPVVIRLLNTNFYFQDARGNGADIRFAKQNGTPLKYQIERWDSAGRKADIWVLVDTVKGNDATQSIKMHWGKADAADSSNGAAVFAAARGFQAVWHLGEAGNLNIDGYRDATSNGNHGTSTEMFSAVEGAVGRAASSQGFGYIVVNDAPSLKPTTHITLSAWFLSTDWGGAGTANQNRRILQKGNDVAPANDYSLREVTGTEELIFGLAGVGSATQPTVANPAENTWNLIHGTYDGVAKSLYLNGVLQSSETASGAIMQNTSVLEIGHRPTSASGGTDWRGMLDEVRVLSTALDANWIKLEYANQKANQTLVSMAPVGVLPGSRAASRPGLTVKAEGRALVFNLPGNTARAAISILDMQGRTLWFRAAQGEEELRWNGVTSGGRQAQPGIYIVQVRGWGGSANSSPGRIITYAP